MKRSFLLALKIYKYLAIVAATAFYIYMTIDDWPLTKYHEGVSDAIFFWAGHFVFVIVYGMIVSIFLWIPVSIGIIGYHKLLRPNNNQEKKNN